MRLRHVFFSAILCNLVLVGSFASSTRGNGPESSIVHGLQPDKFVQYAPLVVAAVCRDGVAIISAHTDESSEPLLYQSLTIESDDDISNSDVGSASPYDDLPKDYGGPFRIHRLDGFGSVLAAAGWRSDCESLADKCRALAASELGRFGKPSRDSLYAEILAEETSLHLAQCAISDRFRPLSCAALLASPDGANGAGRLWLVDATGAYLVRAHCVGGGTIDGTADLVSDLINAQLMETDFGSLSVDEGLRRLLALLSGGTKEVALRHGSRVELGAVDALQRLFVRKSVAFLKHSDRVDA